jgi:hypothetical protein
VGGGRYPGKGEEGCICCKYCIYIYVNAKMIPVETTPRMGGGKGQW